MKQFAFMAGTGGPVVLGTAICIRHARIVWLWVQILVCSDYDP